MNPKGHNSSKEGIPQSSMVLDTQKEPRQMEKDSEWLWVCAVWEEGQNWYRSACIDRGSVVSQSGCATVKGGSAAPRKNGKATNYAPDQIKLKKKVYQEK